MDNSLIQKLENEEDVIGVPVCGANLSSPVYRIGQTSLQKFITG